MLKRRIYPECTQPDIHDIRSLVYRLLLRSRQLKKKQFKIAELRKEIVYNHAQILELQTEYVTLEKSLNISKATVLPMNPVMC